MLHFITLFSPSLRSSAVSALGLILIGFGTGGIKPCVVSFGADQFVLPQQRPEMSTFFGIFYASINFGSMISTILTPIFRKQPCFGEDECYSLAFGVPAILMVVAIGRWSSGFSKRSHIVKCHAGLDWIGNFHVC